MPNVGTNGQLLSDPRLNDLLCCMGTTMLRAMGSYALRGVEKGTPSAHGGPVGVPVLWCSDGKLVRRFLADRLVTVSLR